MEHQFERQEQIIKPESIDDIKVQEVFEREEGYKNAHVLHVRPERTKEEVEAIFRESLVANNWWLQEYWQNKTIKEQIVFKLGDLEVSVYDFNGKLNPEQIQNIESTLRLFSSIRNGEVFDKFKTILIDDLQPQNPFTGNPTNGLGDMGPKAITLYPNALKSIEYRIEGVSNFEGTIIHEFSHSLGSDFRSEWRNKFGWKKRKEAYKLPSGAYLGEYNETPERCVTDYAKINAAEDMCESVVAAQKNPKILDPERLEFIRAELLNQDVGGEQFSCEIRNTEQVAFPRLTQPVLYTRKAPKMVWNSVS